jgi:glycosyltransferase involved in cell wall biosynthesis
MFTVYVLEKDASRISFRNKQIKVTPVPYRWHTFGEQTGFFRQLYKDNLDLMHFTYFSYPILYKRPFIATVHDTILLHNKTGMATTRNPLVYELKHIIFKHVYFKQLRRAVAVITPTQTVKNQILELTDQTYADKIKVIYEGIDKEFIETTEHNLNIYTPYILYVGNFYPHKNISNLIKAMQFISPEIKLVLVGPDGFFLNRIKSFAEDLNLANRLMYYPDASTADMVYLYKHAAALVHPSLEEGFGLPLIEAAYFNTQVVASDISVFHELLGNLYTPFDPTKPEDIGYAITKALQDPKKVDRTSILSKYDFKVMASQIIDIYEKETGSARV